MVSEATRHVMQANKSKNTKPELRVRAALREAGLPGYRLHWRAAPGKPDICYPGRKVAIFVNGCFWHRCPYCALSTPKSNVEFWTAKFARNRARDERDRELLARDGWKVITIWECRLKKNRFDATVARVADEVRRAGSSANKAEVAPRGDKGPVPCPRRPRLPGQTAPAASSRWAPRPPGAIASVPRSSVRVIIRQLRLTEPAPARAIAAGSNRRCSMAVYVTSDAHGHVRALDEVLDQISLASDDVLYVLGDLIDRGPDPLGVILLVRSLPQARVLMGNHEQLMLHATAHTGAPRDGEFDLSGLDNITFTDWFDWMNNGGNATATQLCQLREDEYDEVISWASGLPLYDVAVAGGHTFALVHAGIDAGFVSEWREAHPEADPCEPAALLDLLGASRQTSCCGCATAWRFPRGSWTRAAAVPSWWPATHRRRCSRALPACPRSSA